MSALSAFPYPGGKTPYVDEILRWFPEHRRYVEPFGGSAAVLLNKPPSYIEVYNDRNDDLVHFFRTLRERRDELEAWLREVPYAKTTHERFSREFFEGHRPEDDVERAGRWLYLRYTSYGAKLSGPSGFKRTIKRNDTRTFRNNVERLEAVVERLQEVIVECADYREILERYDRPDTLFYLDPPYGDNGAYYNSEGFDHEQLADALAACEGHWICSYGEIPDPLDRPEYSTIEYTARYSLDFRRGEEARADRAAGPQLRSRRDRRVGPWPADAPRCLGVVGVSSRIVERSDVQVGRPLDRDTIRGTDEGFLATCWANHCDWQGLFPDPVLAKEAVEAHHDHQIQSGTSHEYATHNGVRSYAIVQLLDADRAMTVPESDLDKLDPAASKYDPRFVDRPEFPRTDGDVSEIVQRGDEIELPRGSRQVVRYVTETRAMGLPTWTVCFDGVEADLTNEQRTFRGKNELIARDGQVYQRFGEEPLGAPAIEIVGRSEHQADLSEFGWGASV